MKTKELVKAIKDGDIVGDAFDIKEEIIQKLLELDELKKLAFDASTPLIELFNFLIAISEDYQTGDINYGRE